MQPQPAHLSLRALALTITLACFALVQLAHAQTFTWEFFAGTVGGAGFVNETGPKAQFNHPIGLVSDAAGNLLVADFGNKRWRNVSSAGVVTGGETGAGTYGPRNLARDANSSYAWSLGHAVSWGTRYYGDLDTPGYSDSFGRERMRDPFGVVFDSAGNLIIADSGNHVLRQVDTHTYMTTVAGTFNFAATTPGFTDGLRGQNALNTPMGLAIDASDNIYITEWGNDLLRMMDANGTVTTISGSSAGYQDGTGANAKFNDPTGIVLAGGVLFVADKNNHCIRKVTLGGVVTTFAGSGVAGSADGTGTAASFSKPYGITADAALNLYVTDYENHTIRKITSAGVVTTLAGTADGAGSVDGTGTTAKLDGPGAMCVGADGTVYVAEFDSLHYTPNSKIRQITSAGVVTTPAAFATGSALSKGLALGSDGALYASFESSGLVQKYPPGGSVSTFASGFSNPAGIGFDSAGNLYVTGSATVKKVTSVGTISTLAGSGSIGSTDGLGSNASMSTPRGLAVAADGTAYMADTGNHKVRKISPNGQVITLAGNGTAGYIEGSGLAARFSSPSAATLGPDGLVYVADTGNHCIRRVSMSGSTWLLTGSVVAGNHEGHGNTAQLSSPQGLAFGPDGSLYVANTGGHSILRGTLSPTLGTPSVLSYHLTSASVSFSYNLNHAITTATLDYGATDSYGSSMPVPVPLTSANANMNQTAQVALTGLTPNTQYHYRVRLVNGMTSASSSDATFTTTASPDIEVRDSANTLLTTGSTVDFGILGTPNGHATRTLSITNTGDADLTELQLEFNHYAYEGSKNIPNVAPGATINVTLTAHALAATAPTVKIKSNAQTRPVITLNLTQTQVPGSYATTKTLSVSNVTSTSADVVGSANANGHTRDVGFAVSGDSIYGWDHRFFTGTPATVIGSADTVISAALTTLYPHTKYTVRIESYSNYGDSVGESLSFTTPNRAPVGVPDSVLVLPGSKLIFHPQSNDQDADGDTVRVFSFTQPGAAVGSLSRSGDNLIFTPAAKFTGGSLTYIAKDDFGGKAIAPTTVTLALGNCTLGPDVTVPSDSPPYDLAVTANTQWAVSESLTWITVATPAIGDSMAHITVLPNSSVNSRTGIITIGGQKHTVTQLGVAAAPQIAVPSLVPNGVVAAAYSLLIPVINGPMTFTTTGTGLPPGLTISSSTNRITGKPTKLGLYHVSLTGKNAKGPANKITFDITVLPYPSSTTGSWSAYIDPTDYSISTISRVELTLSSTGNATGKVYLPFSPTYAFTGKLNTIENPLAPDPEHGVIQTNLFSGNVPYYTLTIRLNTPSTGRVTCQLTPVAAPSSITAFVGAKYLTGTALTALKGRYTLALQPTETPATVPQGDGYGYLDIASTGVITSHLEPPDKGNYVGTMVGTTRLWITNEVPIHAWTSYHRIDGTLSLDPATKHLTGSLALDHRSTSGYDDYVAGYSTTVEVLGGSYTAPAKGYTIFNLQLPATAHLNFSRGGIETHPNYADMNLTFGIDTLGIATVIGGNPNQVSVDSFDPATGIFKGSLAMPTPSGSVFSTLSGQFSGIIISAQGFGAGNLMLPNQINSNTISSSISRRVRVTP